MEEARRVRAPEVGVDLVKQLSRACDVAMEGNTIVESVVKRKNSPTDWRQAPIRSCS
jgi:hypothetical protein